MSLEYEVVDCPICGRAPNKVWLEDGKQSRYLQCLVCNTVFASPRTPRSMRYTWLDETFSLNNEIFNLTDSRRPALAREAHLIQQHIQEGYMLDVGCSIGAFFEFFSSDRWECQGVELSPSAAQYAIKTYKVDVVINALREANFQQSSFDLVTLIDTLYYLDDPAADIAEIRKLLKPGGRVAIEVAGQSYMFWRNYGLVPRLLDKRWSRASTDSSYLYWFGPQGLSQLLAKCGLQAYAWYVIPSPRHRNIIINSITNMHFVFLSALSKLSFNSITWAPKYLCIARVAD